MFHIENKIKNNKRTYRDTGVSIGIDSRASGAVKGPDLRGLDVDDIPLISLCTKRTQVNDITNQCGAKKKTPPTFPTSSGPNSSSGVSSWTLKGLLELMALTSGLYQL